MGISVCVFVLLFVFCCIKMRKKNVLNKLNSLKINELKSLKLFFFFYVCTLIIFVAGCHIMFVSISVISLCGRTSLVGGV